MDARRVARAGGHAVEDQALLLFDEVGDLRKRVEALERGAAQNSRNTSLPPSGDRGQGPKRPARKRSGRKPGGQPGS